MYLEYLNELKINGKSPNTISYQESILKEAENFNPLKIWTKEDVNRYFLHLQQKNKKSSVEVKKAVLKKFFTWVGKEEIVKHLRVKFPKTSLKREDILTPEEINSMIDGTESPMYKALIAFTFESGGRVNEILPDPETDKKGILVGEIKETDKGMLIPVHGTKTGDEDRSILCIFSAQFIRNHITYSGLKKTEVLFPIHRPAFHVMLNKIAKKAGIEKPISPHKLRHAQAVDMLRRGYQDQITKKKLGWKDDSKMIARYQHVVDDDVINATLEKSGAEMHRPVITNIKQAEPLKLADASATISKLNTDLEAANDRIATLERKSQEVLDLILAQGRKKNEFDNNKFRDEKEKELELLKHKQR